MTYALRAVEPALRTIGTLPKSIQLAFNDSFEQLAQNPRSTAFLDVHQLHGYQNVWALSIPPFRCVYAIDGQEVVLIIFGHRKTVYVMLHSLLPPEQQYISRSSFGER